MITKTRTLPLQFRPQPWGKRVDGIADVWVGTPYMEGCRTTRGIDCVNFGCMILDMLYGYQRTKAIEMIRGDACLHNKRGVVRAMRAILSTYPAHDRVRDGSLEPADILVAGPVGGGPGHMLVAGGRPGILWHCTRQSGVCGTGYGLDSSMTLFAVYRANDRSSWRC